MYDWKGGMISIFITPLLRKLAVSSLTYPTFPGILVGARKWSQFLMSMLDSGRPIVSTAMVLECPKLVSGCYVQTCLVKCETQHSCMIHSVDLVVCLEGFTFIFGPDWFI